MSRPRLRAINYHPTVTHPHSRSHQCFRLGLAHRHVHHIHPSSTSAFPTSLPNPLQSRIRWTYLWHISILSLGLAVGLGARHFAAPLGLVEPGSHADAILLESLTRDVDALPVIKGLREQAMNLRMGGRKKRDGDTIVEGERKPFKVQGWLEVPSDFLTASTRSDSEPAASASQPASFLPRQGILGAMSGTRGLGVQRAFWNAETREMVAVIWIGGGLAGWPGVCHGGAIATLFGEVMGRMVGGVGERLVADAGKSEGKGGLIALSPPPAPTTLNLTYAKPTHTLDFYILRASFSNPPLPHLAASSESESVPTRSWLQWLTPRKDLKKTVGAEGSVEIEGTLEGVGGQLCVKAKGIFHGENVAVL